MDVCACEHTMSANMYTDLCLVFTHRNVCRPVHVSSGVVTYATDGPLRICIRPVQQDIRSHQHGIRKQPEV